MTVPSLTATTLAGSPDRPLLLLGPSLGTSADLKKSPQHSMSHYSRSETVPPCGESTC